MGASVDAPIDVAEAAYRRGLWQLAGRTLDAGKPGSAIEALIETASDAPVPADLSQRPDHYLYGGGYTHWFSKQQKVSEKAPRKKRARLR